MATSFRGWADAWGNSWGSGDPNAMRGSASFSITGSLQVAAGEMQGSASFSITATLTLPLQNQFSAEVNLTPRRKYYVKRKKRILIFDTLEQADAFVEAEELAQEAIDKAQKTSRRARKRVKTRFVKDVAQPEVIELDLLSRLVKGYAIPVDFPKLIQSQDLQTIAAINLLAMQMQDEEEIELLLMS